MSGPWACDECLRRSWLIGSLSPAIERALSGRPGHRARELLALPDDALEAAVPPTQRGEEDHQRPPTPDPAEMRGAVRAALCWACCRHDGSYPRRLHDLDDAPAVLFGRGGRELLAELEERPAVTVVGSRRPSAYGRDVAQRLGADLARAGLIVVSGLALGIDSCAHEGALSARGRTVAVLGGGPESASPPRARELYGRVVSDGLVLSELPPGTRPRRWSFPARNRIMAALGAMTLVVEARSRSGSLITASMAGDLGREVGAVPGQVGSSSAAGTNALLRDGAQVVRGAADALDSLLGAGVHAGFPEDAPPAVPLPPELAVVAEQVELGASGAEAVAIGSGIPPGRVAAALVRLELLGVVRSDSQGRYRRG